MKSIRDYINLIENAQREGVAEGFLGDREFNRVMPFVKRIAGEVTDYDRDEFGEELWSLLDQKYGSKFAQSVLDDLDVYWHEYSDMTGQGVAEAEDPKKDVEAIRSAIARMERELADPNPHIDRESLKQRIAWEKRRLNLYRDVEGVAEEQLEETSPEAIAKIGEITRR